MYTSDVETGAFKITDRIIGQPTDQQQQTKLHRSPFEEILSE